MKVLYVHGLESGPRGMKVERLKAAGFEVEAVQMPCNRQHALKDPLTIGLIIGAVAGVVAMVLWKGIIGFMGGVMLIAVLSSTVRRFLTRRMFRKSVEVQKQMLATRQIEVVVGSSFGGAVTLQLISDGAWKGPTVLLCPAQRLVAERAWIAAPTLPKDMEHVLVVHGTRDEVVPLFHSKELVKGTKAKLIEVNDLHRLSDAGTVEAFAAWVKEVNPLS